MIGTLSLDPWKISNRPVIAPSVLGLRFGNHVGDWEHTMVRFINGTPNAVYFSAHSGGSAYKYSAVEKVGDRPVTYIGNGTHANYPVRLQLYQRSQPHLISDCGCQDCGRSSLRLIIWPSEGPDEQGTHVGHDQELSRLLVQFFNWGGEDCARRRAGRNRSAWGGCQLAQLWWPMG